MLQVSHLNGVTTVAFQPNTKLSIANTAEVKAALISEVKGENGQIVVDMTNLDYIDSSGVGALLSLLRACREHKWTLTIRKPQQGVRDLFNLLQLQSIFNIE